MGICEDFLVHPKDVQLFTCPICKDILDHPVDICTANGHLLCDQCAAQLPSPTRNAVDANGQPNPCCPVCRARSKNPTPAFFVKRLIDGLDAKCSGENCSFTDTLAMVLRHVNFCVAFAEPCPNRGCKELVVPGERAEHLMSCTEGVRLNLALARIDTQGDRINRLEQALELSRNTTSDILAHFDEAFRQAADLAGDSISFEQALLRVRTALSEAKDMARQHSSI